MLAVVAAMLWTVALAVPGVAGAASGDPTVGGAAAVVRMTALGVPARDRPALRPAVAGNGRRIVPLRLPHRPGLLPAAVSEGPLSVSAATLGGEPQRVFDGVDATQQAAASGFDLEPPDQGFGASSSYKVNFVNVVGAVYGPTGAVLEKPFYLNDFFQEPADAFTSDPRVFFDPSANRWFATILEAQFDANLNTTESHVDLAASAGPNPMGSWRVYRIPATDIGHNQCPCLADYPILGVDSYNVYISTNEYTSDGFGFNGAQLYAISKAQLTPGVANPPVLNFQNLSIDGDPNNAFHVQPANTYTPFAPAEYMLSSLDPTSTSDSRLAVWALSNPWLVGRAAGLPRLSVRVIASEPYSFPPRAQTPPGFCPGACSPTGEPQRTTGVVDTDFDAMEEVQYINGQLVGALNTGVTIPGDATQRAGVAWFVVSPSINILTGGLNPTTHVTRQGYLSQKNEYLLYPHVNMTQAGGMAMAFTLGGPHTFLSAAYSIAPAGGSFTNIQIAAAGTHPDDGFVGTPDQGGVGRWGDYSNGEIIPGTNTVWLATGYIPNAGDGLENWGNAIFEVSAP